MPEVKTNQEKIIEEAERLKQQVKTKEEEKALAAQDAYRKDLANKRALQDLDHAAQLRQKGYTTDRSTGKPITLWEDLNQAASSAANSEQHAYNDWRSAMMSLLSLYAKFVKTLSHSVDETLQPAKDKIAQTVREHIFYPIKDKFMDLIRSKPDIDLPALVHNVKMSDEGKLVVGDVVCDGHNPDRDINRSFETLVNLWLVEKGYVPGPDDTYVSNDEHKTPLTKEMFNHLKDDNNNGLNAFFENHVDLQIRQGPEP
jgi:hypothetical protein